MSRKNLLKVCVLIAEAKLKDALVHYKNTEQVHNST